MKIKAWFNYQLLSFFYSLRWMPPAVVYLVWIYLQYNYKSVPILDSYSVSAASLYIVMVWMSMQLFSLDQKEEKFIIFSYLRVKTHYLYGKMAVLLFVGTVLMSLSFLLPVLLDIFAEPITIIQVGLFLYSHWMFCLLGIGTGGLFSVTNLSGKKYTWLLAALFTVASLVAPSIGEVLPGILKWTIYILPPVSAITGLMAEGDRMYKAETIWVCMYTGILFTILTRLFVKNERLIR
ncbi:hypothetical protein JOC78_000429 [Bacillus ectoiniformans]|uniref:hypothetical protein n=1 Tax=Bacillus ectoiniformans TaxID=1494429 RepID=UPI001959F905|nr:hypothetical protein [Bacillus ectoiniformans]MBM7647508.1 hypothetical protein [Bacillus ectoiniformans]